MYLQFSCGGLYSTIVRCTAGSDFKPAEIIVVWFSVLFFIPANLSCFQDLRIVSKTLSRAHKNLICAVKSILVRNMILNT